LDWYYDVFGPENFFLELQSHDIPEIPKLNKDLLALGERYKANFVATNDVHYVDQSDARLQDIMLCVQTSSLLNDPKRMRMSDNSYYLKPGSEMKALFANVPEAISNSLLIAERCNVDLSTDGYVLPEFEVPAGFTDKTYLRDLCDKGLEMRYGSQHKDEVFQERLEYELGIIDEMGFNAYFLIVWDLCQFSQKEGIWYNARGSAAGSIVAYALEITLVDPIDHELIFERFLNPGRVSMPDIDLDFQDDQRYRLLEYTAKRYGEDKVASIITFGKLKARAAVRDVGRVMDIPLSEVDKIAKMIPSMPLNMTINQALETTPDLMNEYQSKGYVKDLLDNARQVEGSLRNAGTHAAGVVVTDKPVVEYIPLHRPTGASAEDTPIKTVTQFEMSTIDALGLLKVDFLGLSTLTIMQRCTDMIKERHGVDLNINNIPLDDEETFKQLSLGNTAGVFQLEGTGMTRWVMEMKPKSLPNVIAMVALYRPGPMEFIPSYVRRMHGKEEITYRHELLEPILKETYGITVYQEQIMYAAMNVGGYTASEADFLRKAVAKKKEKDLLKNKEKFVEGAGKNGVSREIAEKIFADWEAFANYGFPKGHAADYAVIAVETAYLKTHYAVEYMAALLSVYQSNSDKVAFYAADCRNMGIEVLSPSINESNWEFTIEDVEDGNSNVRFGMGAVKNVGKGPVEALIEARKEGIFEDLTDLANRVDLRKVGKRALESLIKAGALDQFGPRMALLQVMEKAISISSSQFQAAEEGQLSFFGADSGIVQKIEIPKVDPDYNKREQLNWERELVGLFISDHPLRPVMEDLKNIVSHFSSQLAHTEDQQLVKVAGMVSRIRPHITKKGDQMAFVALEDTHGIMNLVIFPRTWKEVQELMEYDKVVIVDGKIDAQGGEPKILVDRVSTNAEYPKPFEEKSTHRNKQVQEEPQAKIIKEQKPKTYTNSLKSESFEKPSENETVDPADDNIDLSKMPPQPDVFPMGWEEEFGTNSAISPKNSQPDNSSELDTSESKKIEEDLNKNKGENQNLSSDVVMQEKVRVGELKIEEGIKESQKLSLSEPGEIPSVASAETDSKFNPSPPVPMVLPPKQPDAPVPAVDGKPRMATVVLRNFADLSRDNLRMRRVHGMLISYPGIDRFAFYVIERERGYRIEFPNDTTHISSDMIARIEAIVGKENVIIEEITFQ